MEWFCRPFYLFLNFSSLIQLIWIFWWIFLTMPSRFLQKVTTYLWKPKSDHLPVRTRKWPLTCEDQKMTTYLWKPDSDHLPVRTSKWPLTCENQKVTTYLWRPESDHLPVKTRRKQRKSFIFCRRWPWDTEGRGLPGLYKARKQNHLDWFSSNIT